MPRPSNIWPAVQITKLLTLQPSPLPCYFLPLVPKHLPHDPILKNTLSLRSPIRVTECVLFILSYWWKIVDWRCLRMGCWVSSVIMRQLRSSATMSYRECRNRYRVRSEKFSPFSSLLSSHWTLKSGNSLHAHAQSSRYRSNVHVLINRCIDNAR